MRNPNLWLVVTTRYEHGRRINTIHHEVRNAANNLIQFRRCCLAKSQGVTTHNPHDRHQRSQRQTLHQDGQNVLGANKPTVEQCQGWNCHKQYQCGGCKNPSRIAGINRRLGLLCVHWSREAQT